MTKKKIQNIINKYKKVLGLTIWDISFKLVKDMDSSAEIKIMHEYHNAEIKICLENIDKKDLDYVIKHELCHIITEPLYLYSIDLLNFRSRSVDTLEKERERATDWIARVL